MSKTVPSLLLIVGEDDPTYRLFSLWVLALILTILLLLKSVLVKYVNRLYEKIFDRDPLTLIAYSYFSVLAVLVISELVFTLINKYFHPVWQPFNIRRDYIVFAIPLIILAVLSVLEWTRSTFLNQRLQRIHKKPFTIITIITIIILSAVTIFEGSTYNHFQNSNLINIFSVIGIFGTIVGLIITYEQLRLAEDRIDGYESLYEALSELLCDRKARYFQFYGTTVIPGQIAFGDDREITNYRTNFLSLLTNVQATKKVTIIAPSENVYEEAYAPYLNKRYRNEVFTQEKINSLLQSVTEFQKQLSDFTKVNFIPIDRNVEIDFVDSFYYSNGKMVIYAVPLHYNLERVREAEATAEANAITEIEPTLIGFKTTNRSMVKAFEKVFDKMVIALNDANRPETIN